MMKTTNTTADVAAAILRILAMDAETRKKSLRFEMSHTPANDDSKRRIMGAFFENSPSVMQTPPVTTPVVVSKLTFNMNDLIRDNTKMTIGKPAGRLHDFGRNRTLTALAQDTASPAIIAPASTLDAQPVAILSSAFADTAAAPQPTLATKRLTVQQDITDRAPVPAPAAAPRNVLPFPSRRPTLS